MAVNRKASPGRRSLEESRREILDAAAQMLWEVPLAELTVGGLMARTRLGRSSFYVHFEGVDDLIAALLADLETQLWTPASRWIEATSADDGRALLNEAVAGVVDVWVSHGPVLRAIVEGSMTNPVLHRLWRDELIERFVDGVHEGMRRLAPTPAAAPPREVATALLLMNERYLADRLGRTPQHDPREVTATLTHVWSQVLYN